METVTHMIPVFRDHYENWTIRIFNRGQHECRNYLSPNRRDFYKILFVSKGAGVFTMGLNTYYIDQPSILFIHPNEIISWKNLSPGEAGGYYALFRKEYIQQHPLLKASMEKYGLFTEKDKHVIRLTDERVTVLNGLFEKMKQEELADGEFHNDAIMAYVQLVLVESAREAHFTEANIINDEFRHVHSFFELLEQEASHISRDTPIRLKTAKEFASSLAIHPNYLNVLLKKHTGENVSSHIKSRLLDEAKVLLLRTDWSLQDVANSIGFAEQPNFNQFFKKNTGTTPTEFRKNLK